MKSKSTNYKFMIGHVRPEFKLWDDWMYVTSQPQSEEDFVIYKQDIGSPILTDYIAGEYFYLFCLRRKLLAEGIRVEKISIAQYRRFVINERIGTKEPIKYHVEVVPPEIAEVLDLNTLSNDKGFGFLISTIVSFPVNYQPSVMRSLLKPRDFLITDMMSQYADSHPIRDLLRFTSDLLDAGILSDEQSINFLLGKMLIPAPSNGTFPFEVFLKINETLENAAIVFLEGGYILRDGYQRRSIGFCLERLNSFLLLEELKERGIDPLSVMGQQMMVSSDGKVATTV